MIETERLILRPWREEDAGEFARVTNTPAVMAHLGGVRDPDAYVETARTCRRLQAEHGFCFWLVERTADRAILGFCGLEPTGVAATPIAADVEIGWRLREDAWGKGYAREAAEASLAWAWENTDLPRIVAMTVPANRRSWGLMDRLGMIRRPDLDYGHPLFAADHPLHAHIVYVADRPWRKEDGGAGRQGNFSLSPAGRGVCRPVMPPA